MGMSCLLSSASGCLDYRCYTHTLSVWVPLKQPLGGGLDLLIRK